MGHPVNPIYSGRFLNFFETESGWEFVSRKKTPLIAGGHGLDAVIIVPMVVEDGKVKLVFTREWREPLQDFVWGFPAGLVDEGESPKRTVFRELKEETGLDGIDIIYQTPAMFSSEGMTDEAVAAYYITAEGEVTDKYQEANEKISVVMVDRDKAESILIACSMGEMIGKVAYMVLQDFVNTGFSWLFDKEK